MTKTCTPYSSDFESVDEVLWCDDSNETSLAVLTCMHGTINFVFQYFRKIKLRFYLHTTLLVSMIEGLRTKTS